MGGVEANCELHLTMHSGATGIVEASRIRSLRNTCIIKGERGTLEVGIWDKMGLLKLNLPNQPIALKTVDTEACESWHDVLRRQLVDFSAAIRDGRETFITGVEGRRSIQLIQDCYASRRLLSHPWLLHATKPAQTALGVTNA
jgi:predicted dehydrogenase